MKIYSKHQYKEEARNSLLRGADQVYNAVAPTLGAKGRTIVLWKSEETKTLQDGVNIAKKVNPEDPFENAGAEILKQAAHRQVAAVGDGTTVTIILGFQLAKEAQKIINSGVNPVGLKDSLEKGRDLVLAEIEKAATPLSQKDSDEIKYIATISAKEKRLGEMIGDIYAKHGKSAVIVPETGGFETEVEHQDGMRLNAGFAHPYFATNPQTGMANQADTYTLVLDYHLTQIIDLNQLLTEVKKSGKGLTVFVKELDADPLALFLQNKLSGKLRVSVIKVPSFKSRETLEDIALATGAKLISQEAGMALKDIKFEDLGFAAAVQATDKTTIIIDGAADEKLIKARVKQLKKEEKEADSPFEAEKARERLARLTGGVYVLRVGGSSEVEIEERKERADDAIRATFAALERGYVPGGEVVYLDAVNSLKPETEADEYAFRILSEALKQPFRTLMNNAGMDPGQMIERLSQIGDKEMGVDVKSGSLAKMVEVGIIDPAKALEEAIKNAVSVATQIITSEGIVAEFVEEDGKK